MFGDAVKENVVKPIPQYSYATDLVISYTGNGEFASAINGKNSEKVLAVIDELIGTIQVTWPKLYEATIKKIKSIPG